ncbi:MAG TPA: ABC transporter substrate-binding protein [Xanthobacteraceae bacterium]|jgi:NitT/TauT family transport system substrate-binding protein
MESGEPSGKPEVTKSSPLRPSRRMMLALAGAFGAATPLATIGAARALTASRADSFSNPLGEIPLCRAAMAGERLSGPRRALTLAWNASSICTVAGPVAKERGVFAKHNLDVDFVNFGGSTEQLLEAIATGKADAGIGMALRWLKPLEQGFDVRVAAGVHGGCLRLLGSKSAGITSLELLRGKSIAISDQASPAKHFCSIVFAKNGIDPVKDVDWRQYPLDLLALAVDKGEVQALADNDPRTYLWLKAGKLNEVLTNLSGEFADRICCVLAIRGSLVRNEWAVASAFTRAVLEAGDMVAREPAAAAAVYSAYGGKGPLEDLAAMLASHTHHNHPVGAALKQQISLYADELKRVNVMKRSTDTAKFAERVYIDILS